MGRPKDPERRAELLGAVTEYVLEHGLAHLSLRPLARAVGTSPRILLYHFGSKEELVASALREARAREAATMASYRASAAHVPLAELLHTAWRWVSAERNERFLRLFFEVYGLALQDPSRFPGFLDSVVADWLPMVESTLCEGGIESGRARAMAPLVVAVQRGLLLDLLATGARRRVNRAHRDFVDGLLASADVEQLGSLR
jgi:AcrR family transcriptional regulator